MRVRNVLAMVLGLTVPFAFRAERSEAQGQRAPGAFPPFSLQPLQSFEQGEIPESVTTDETGNLYFSVGNSVRQRTPAGQVSVPWVLPESIFALGVKVGLDGCVYTASTSLDPEVQGAFVWRLCEPGAVEVYAELDHSGGPNDLAFDRNGDLYVTDPVLGRVWRIAPGQEPQVWAEDELLEGDPSAPALLFRPLGANGIARGRAGFFLYVTNTDRGTVLRLPLFGAAAGQPYVLASDPALRGADGIALDAIGGAWVSVNASDSLFRVGIFGNVQPVAQGAPLDGPSSLVFGATPANRHELYVASSAFSRTLGLQPGTPSPALLVAPVLVGGAPLLP